MSQCCICLAPIKAGLAVCECEGQQCLLIFRYLSKTGLLRKFLLDREREHDKSRL